MKLERELYVTQSYLPPYDDLKTYLDTLYASHQLTNHGQLLQALERELEELLHVEHLQCLANGTLALQLALRALDVTGGEVITTPFSYVATVSSIMWEGCTPVFVDIEPDNLTLDPAKIEAAITPRTKAIMPVHVFGYACDVDAIQAVADKHGLKVIYDGAHAFASRYKGQSLLAYGDITTCSFHATKLFHTVEGGACITRDAAVNARLDLLKRFGHHYDEHIMLGINAKQSELHAAMGLANLRHIEHILACRKALCEQYDALLAGCVGRPKAQPGLEYNYSYYPVIFDSEQTLLRVFAALRDAGVYPRRYFYPSLTSLPYVQHAQPCPGALGAPIAPGSPVAPVADNVAVRIASLPLFVGLQADEVAAVCAIIQSAV